MKKALTATAFLSILLYVISSITFPAIGERLAVPVMIVCLTVGSASLIALLTIYTRERRNR